MRRTWGVGSAGRLTRRLQQLEAMTSLDDLGFMPFDSEKLAGGVIEIAIDDDLSIFVTAVTPTEEDGHMPGATVRITAVSAKTMTAS